MSTLADADTRSLTLDCPIFVRVTDTDGSLIYGFHPIVSSTFGTRDTNHLYNFLKNDEIYSITLNLSPVIEIPADIFCIESYVCNETTTDYDLVQTVKVADIPEGESRVLWRDEMGIPEPTKYWKPPLLLVKISPMLASAYNIMNPPLAASSRGQLPAQPPMRDRRFEESSSGSSRRPTT